MKTEQTLCSPKVYGRLELTNFADYWAMLGSVPPAHRAGGAFACGEPYADRIRFGGEFPDEEAGDIVYHCYFAVEGDGYDESNTYLHGYFTLKDYKAVTREQLRDAATIEAFASDEARETRVDLLTGKDC